MGAHLPLRFNISAGLPALGQEQSEDGASADAEQRQKQKKEQLNVNWLYGAYVPKEAPLVPLTVHQREKLFVRQTFTTPGIYVKSGFLALLSQARGEPYQWGEGMEGYGRRVAPNYARTAIQKHLFNSGKRSVAVRAALRPLPLHRLRSQNKACPHPELPYL
jgi:hypothetical protein